MAVKTNNSVKINSELVVAFYNNTKTTADKLAELAEDISTIADKLNDEENISGKDAEPFRENVREAVASVISASQKFTKAAEMTKVIAELYGDLSSLQAKSLESTQDDLKKVLQEVKATGGNGSN